jgi:uncharacterized protein (TIGR02145 family)
MKALKLISLASCALLFSQCKSPTQAAKGPSPSLYEVAQILDSTQTKFIAYSALNNGNAPQAIMQTTSWLQSQPNVQSATALDSIYITITLKSGLQTTFSFDETDSAGYSLFKGGVGSAKEPTLSHNGVSSNNTITNKNVLIYCAGCKEFYKSNEIQNTVDILNSSSAGLNVTMLKDDQCTYPLINTFQNYGFVIIDSHGSNDGFMTGTKITLDNTIVSDDLFKARIIAQGGQDMFDRLLSGELRLINRAKGSKGKPYWQKAYNIDTVYLDLNVTTKFIDRLSPMPGTVIMGSMCYSGWQNPIPSGNTPIKNSFLNKNLISYYGFAFNDGYSAPVSVFFAKEMEDTLSRGLVWDFDSTQIANLASDDHESEYYDPRYAYGHLLFKHYGADDYSYPKPCGDTLIDQRDGKKYVTVCIGKQKWMAENLDYFPTGSGSACYNNDPGNCATYGMLYDWNTMMQGAAATNANPSGVRGICPQGWHVPSDAEFQQLFSYLGSGAAGAMKSTSGLWTSTNVGATNSSGFSALPGGYIFSMSNVTASSLELGSVAMFGTTSTTAQSGTNPSWNLWGLWNYASSPSSSPGDIKSGGESCRCVKDP